MNAQLLGDLGHTLAVRLAHSPANISLDALVVWTHRSTPSGPLVVEMDGLERRHLCYQRGPEPVAPLHQWREAFSTVSKLVGTLQQLLLSGPCGRR